MENKMLISPGQEDRWQGVAEIHHWHSHALLEKKYSRPYKRYRVKFQTLGGHYCFHWQMQGLALSSLVGTLCLQSWRPVVKHPVPLIRRKSLGKNKAWTALSVPADRMPDERRWTIWWRDWAWWLVAIVISCREKGLEFKDQVAVKERHRGGSWEEDGNLDHNLIQREGRGMVEPPEKALHWPGEGGKDRGSVESTTVYSKLFHLESGRPTSRKSHIHQEPGVRESATSSLFLFRRVESTSVLIDKGQVNSSRI